ncbi:MAG: LAGLIDADG family homing endonuclease [bacterium]|nr:LAGLIDADG family homing endonuclease [bacterium]
MAHIASLQYPKKSHRKKVTIPKHSVALAEFFGIMLGDGGINNPWQATITLNAIKDRLYAIYIKKMIKDLFGVVPSSFVYKTRDALRILANGVSLVDFLVSEGLPRGNKLRAGLMIPTWILRNNKYSYACVRGLIDTDGCMFIHTHTVGGKVYKNIGLAFSSRSPELIGQVAAILEKSGIIPHVNLRGTDIYIYRKDAVERYLKIFGSSNTRISSVYKKWRGA